MPLKTQRIHVCRAKPAPVRTSLSFNGIDALAGYIYQINELSNQVEHCVNNVNI